MKARVVFSTGFFVRNKFRIMSLLEDAKQLAENITKELNDFSTPLVFTSPTGQIVSVNGLYSDHTMTYDAEGNAINGKQTHVTVSESLLLSAGYNTRDSRGFISLTDHKVLVTYVDGSTKTYVIDDVRPDYTINLLLLFLSEYGTN